MIQDNSVPQKIDSNLLNKTLFAEDNVGNWNNEDSNRLFLLVLVLVVVYIMVVAILRWQEADGNDWDWTKGKTHLAHCYCDVISVDMSMYTLINASLNVA